MQGARPLELVTAPNTVYLKYEPGNICMLKVDTKEVYVISNAL